MVDLTEGVEMDEGGVWWSVVGYVRLVWGYEGMGIEEGGRRVKERKEWKDKREWKQRKWERMKEKKQWNENVKIENIEQEKM